MGARADSPAWWSRRDPNPGRFGNTALVFEGVVRRVEGRLAELLARDGFARVSEAVGAESIRR